MFDFDKFIEDFLSSYLPVLPIPKASIPVKASFLPEVKLSLEFEKQINKDYLDFLTGLFLASPTLNEKAQTWFIKEIAYNLRISYSNLSIREYEQILMQIIASVRKERTSNT